MKNTITYILFIGLFFTPLSLLQAEEFTQDNFIEEAFHPDFDITQGFYSEEDLSYLRAPHRGNRYFDLACESLRNFPRTCNLRVRSAYRVQLIRQYSRSDCRLNSSWWVNWNRGDMVVTRGCRALFRVYY